MDTRGGGLFPLLRDVSSSPRLRVLSGARRPSSCTDQRPELHRFYPRLGEYLLCRLLVFLIQAIISHVLFIVVQFAPTKSLPDHSVPGCGVRQRRLVHASLAHRI